MILLQSTLYSPLPLKTNARILHHFYFLSHCPIPEKHDELLNKLRVDTTCKINPLASVVMSAALRLKRQVEEADVNGRSFELPRVLVNAGEDVKWLYHE